MISGNIPSLAMFSNCSFVSSAEILGSHTSCTICSPITILLSSNVILVVKKGFYVSSQVWIHQAPHHMKISYLSNQSWRAKANISNHVIL